MKLYEHCAKVKMRTVYFLWRSILNCFPSHSFIIDEQPLFYCYVLLQFLYARLNQSMKANKMRKLGLCTLNSYTLKIIKTKLLTFFIISKYVVVSKEHDLNTNKMKFKEHYVVKQMRICHAKSNVKSNLYLFPICIYRPWPQICIYQP